VWSRVNDQVRLAAVSSFGFTGTNAHVVIEEYYRPRKAPIKSDEPLLLCLSARTPASLKKMARSYLGLLESESPGLAREICQSAYMGRAHFKERISIVGRDCDQLISNLKKFIDGKSDSKYFRGSVVEVPTMIFSK